MKKTIDGAEIDFNARAFGEDPVEKKVATSEETTADASQAESGKEEKEEEQSTSGTEIVVEEQKVPYSRLKTAIDRARKAERDAEEANHRAERLERQGNKSSKSDEPYADAIRSRVIKLYGDNDIAKEIIEIEIAQAQRFEEIAEKKAYEALDKRESMSRTEIESNERVLEDKLEDFTLSIGRDLTPAEEESLLEIADKYSPVGADGKYLSGEPLPLDRAWEILEMQRASEGQASKKARSQATALTSSKTDGETTTEAAAGEWYPGRWRDRLNKK